jgi:hypothetical protein
MKRSAAILVGVDAYAQQPLTSAVNDARAMRDVLVALGLVAAEDIRLLTAPADDPADLATKRNISDALRGYYTGAARADRLFFFFAGHGMTVYMDAARSRTSSVILPVDVVDLDADGLYLISIDELVDRMRYRGPAEQLYFIDACRDLPYERHPEPGPLGWSAEPAEATRAQAVLYAVSRLGQAVGRESGRGVFTTHLVDALKGAGLALDYAEDLDTYVVTPQSIRNLVRDRVETTVSGLPLWQRRYMLPELHAPDPQLEPIREIPDPPPATLTVHIDPESVAADTTVTVWKSRHALPAPSWPPVSNHAPVQLEPQRYTLVASSTAGTALPDRFPIDVRMLAQATIRVQAGGDGPPAATAEPGRPRLRTDGPHEGRTALAESPAATVRAAAESAVTIELVGQQPPYERHTAMGELHVQVPSGPYLVRFRLGPEVYNALELFLLPGEHAEVEPTLPTSPLIRELLEPDADQSAVEVSETIGWFQAGVVETVLPIIGIKPFDLVGALFGRFDGVVPQVDPAGYGDRPLSVVVAIDGDGWPIPAAEVARSVSVRVTGHDGTPLQAAEPVPLTGPTEGFGRITLRLAPAPPGSFAVVIESAYLGALTLMAASHPARATVLTVQLGSDGAAGVTQNVLRLPGRHYDEPGPDVPPGVMLRQLQLGQQLYRSGELAAASQYREGLQGLMELFYGKWTDPILGCMAFFAWQDAVAHGDDLGIPAGLAAEVGDNLLRWFGDLPDSRVVHALASAADRDAALDVLLDRDQVPVLTRAARVLAERAAVHRPGAAVLDAVRRTVDPTWTMWWQAAPAAMDLGVLT